MWACPWEGPTEWYARDVNASCSNISAYEETNLPILEEEDREGRRRGCGEGREEEDTDEREEKEPYLEGLQIFPPLLRPSVTMETHT